MYGRQAFIFKLGCFKKNRTNKIDVLVIWIGEPTMALLCECVFAMCARWDIRELEWVINAIMISQRFKPTFVITFGIDKIYVYIKWFRTH